MSSVWYCGKCDARLSDSVDTCPHCNAPEIQEEMQSEIEALQAKLNVAITALEQISKDKWRIETTVTYEGPTEAASIAIETLAKINDNK